MVESLSIIAIVVSVAALAVSIMAMRQGKKTALVGHRLEAINHVRTAMFDVNLDGNITTKTVASIREASQLSSLVFSSTVSGMLDRAHETAFRLQNIPLDRQTDQDDQDKDTLAGELEIILKAMQKETALGK
jgi:hypothetical protein